MISDLLICALDIISWSGLLLIINYFISGSTKIGLPYVIPGNGNQLVVPGIFLLLYGVKSWLGYRTTASANNFFYGVASRLSKESMERYLDGTYTDFVQTDSSVQIRKISQQPIEFSNYILTNVQQVFTQGLLIAFTVTAICFYRPTLFLSLFLILLPPVFLLGFLIKKQLSKVRTDIKTTSQKAIQYLQESLAGFVEGNIYNSNSFFTERYRQRQQQLNQHIAAQQNIQALPSRLIEVFAIIGFFLLIGLNKFFTKSPVALVDIGVFVTASYKIIPGLVKILNSLGQIKTYLFIVPDLKKAEPIASTEALATAIENIRFDNVSFGYKDTLISNLNFALMPGDFAGIAGASGKGKTTIINLLLGFLDQTAGEILVNHTSANAAQRQSFFSRISYVKQLPFFINDSILKNITLSDDGFDASKLNEVVQFCGIESLLTSEGLEKPITENGKNLSGGQRKRLMLARALYHGFDLLILDEPFSELDERTEQDMLVKLRALADHGKMILMITHNQTNLSYCDKIIAVEPMEVNMI